MRSNQTRGPCTLIRELHIYLSFLVGFHADRCEMFLSDRHSQSLLLRSSLFSNVLYLQLNKLFLLNSEVINGCSPATWQMELTVCTQWYRMVVLRKNAPRYSIPPIKYESTAKPTTGKKCKRSIVFRTMSFSTSLGSLSGKNSGDNNQPAWDQ